MKASDYIESTQNYLDYLKEHIENVRRAFQELSEACDGKDFWVADDFAWHTIRGEVINHDLSKLTKNEFIQYRDFFYPVCESDKVNSDFGNAWENHKSMNPHHHESIRNDFDIVHMVIDWTAMSYKFGGSPLAYFRKEKHKMNLTDDQFKYTEKLLGHLEDHRAKNNGNT